LKTIAAVATCFQEILQNFSSWDSRVSPLTKISWSFFSSHGRISLWAIEISLIQASIILKLAKFRFMTSLCAVERDWFAIKRNICIGNSEDIMSFSSERQEYFRNLVKQAPKREYHCQKTITSRWYFYGEISSSVWLKIFYLKVKVSLRMSSTFSSRTSIESTTWRTTLFYSVSSILLYSFCANQKQRDRWSIILSILHINQRNTERQEMLFIFFSKIDISYAFFRRKFSLKNHWHNWIVNCSCVSVRRTELDPMKITS
jgi:hypothetical protein